MDETGQGKALKFVPVISHPRADLCGKNADVD